jgi:ParB-like chromosome segregation protein Spo0J
MATRYILVDGGRRWLACQLGGIKALNAIVLKQRPTPLELLRIQASLDFHDCRLTWGERIGMVARLHEDHGYSVNDLSALLNISQPLATKLLRTRTVAPAVRELLDAGKLDIEKAYILSGEPDHAKQVELLKDAGSLTREHLRQKARAAGQPADLKASVARFALPKGITVTVQGPKMNLVGGIDALAQAVRELKKCLADGLDISTASRVLKDKAQPTRLSI